MLFAMMLAGTEISPYYNANCVSGCTDSSLMKAMTVLDLWKTSTERNCFTESDLDETDGKAFQ